MSWQPGTQPLQLQADQANLAGKIKQQNCQVAAMGISARIAMPRPVEMPRIERYRTIFVCFFCEAKGHKKSRCPHMKRLLNAGEIHLDWKRRICLGPSGSGYRPVWKPQGMSMMQAVLRAQSADAEQVKVQQVQTDPQMTLAEVLKLLKETRLNIWRSLVNSVGLDRYKTPAWNL